MKKRRDSPGPVIGKAARLPNMPKANARGEIPAVAYARASLARKLIQARVNAGLSQRALAKLAGVRFETICRIETGKHSPNVATVDRIERAIRRNERRAGR